MKINIRLVGCDDTTEFDMDITPKEYEFLKKIAEKSIEVSEYACMPIMKLTVKVN